MAFNYMENQFLTVVITHLLAVISPGPDFALISRQSVKYGRRASVFTSLGIGFGILFHVTYCILGIEILFEKNFYTEILTLLCSAYLFYLGLSSILSSRLEIKSFKSDCKVLGESSFHAFLTGLITNVLNVKATLFFLSLYAFLEQGNINVSINTKLLYGIWMALITTLWFVFLSVFLTNKKFNIFYNKYYILINRLMGFILIYIGIKICLNYYK